MENDDPELSKLLHEWEAPEAPPWLEQRILARIHVRSRLRLGAAMALAATLAAVLLVPPRPPRRSKYLSGEEPFVGVPNVLPLDSYETGRVVRLDVPVSALLAAGYRLTAPDPTATVKADVLIGEDGRAHAVRLVSDSTSTE